MYVPDPGLMSKIQTLLSVGDSFMDTQISCSDGPIFWNSLLLAASSKYLKEMLAGSDASDDLVLILPNFSRNLVFQSLRKLVELGTLEFTTREKELLHILGVVHKDDFRSKGKVVQILSSSNFHNPHYRPVLVSEGDDEDDENDVDIIFENDSDGSESRDELDGKDDEVEMTDDEDEVRITAEDDENENNTYLNWEVSKLDDDDPNMTIDSLSSYYDGITEKEKPEEETKNVEATKKEAKTKTNTCRGCNKRFDNSEYKEHIAKFPEHANSKLKPRSELVCRLCNIDFKIKGLTAFREHVTKHRNMDGDFSCKECGKKTNKWGHLMQHMYRHGWKRPFNCDLCNYSTINKSNLVNHINIKHEKPDSRDYICPQCDKQFKSSNNLNAHMKTHEDILLRCEFCAKTFKSDLGLSQHRRIHNGVLIHCKVCDEAFQSLHGCKRHEKLIHNYHRDVEGDLKFFCNLKDCDAAFVSEEHKRTHWKKDHKDNPSFLRCDICNVSSFNTKHLLRLHRKDCQLEKASSLRRISLLRPEDKLEYNSGTKIKLKLKGWSVLRSEKEIIKDLNCKCCDTLFKYEYELLAHKILKKNEGLYCSFQACAFSENKQLSSQSDLLSHLLKHTGESVLKCSYCEKMFPRENLLKKHESTHNIALIQFVCPFQNCGSKFWNVSEFDEHMVEHDPEHNHTKFTCYICDKEFNSMELKEEHLNGSHPDEIVTSYSCSHCGDMQPSLMVHKMHEKYCRNKRAEEHRPSYSCTFCAEKVSSISEKMQHEQTCRKNLMREGNEVPGEAVEETQVEIFNAQQDDLNRYFYDICQRCKKIFVNFKDYVDHLRREHNENENEEIACNICGKSVLLTQLEDHLALDHSPGSLFICEPCSLSYELLEELEKHNFDYHQPLVGFSWIPASSRFSCNFCTKMFKTKGGALKHVNSVHQAQLRNQFQLNLGKEQSMEEEMILLEQQVDGVEEGEEGEGGETENQAKQFVNPPIVVRILDERVLTMSEGGEIMNDSSELLGERVHLMDESGNITVKNKHIMIGNVEIEDATDQCNRLEENEQPGNDNELIDENVHIMDDTEQLEAGDIEMELESINSDEEFTSHVVIQG